MSAAYRAIVSAVNHPDVLHGTWGLFNSRSLSALCREGVDLDVVVPRPYAPPVGPLSAYSKIPEVHDFGPYEIYHPRFWYFLPKRLFYGLSGRSFSKNVNRYIERRFGVQDIAHGCHLYPDGYAMMTYARTHGIPFTTVAHGTLLNKFENQLRSVQNAIRETLYRSEQVLCVSHALVEKAEKIEPRTRAKCVPIGATPSNFPTGRKAALREEFGVPTDATVVMYCGAFSEQKGIDDLIAVLPEMGDEDLYFVFIGHAGGRREALEKTLADSDHFGQVLWKVNPEVVRQWFALADLFVLPSYSEGRPTVVYEAMASKTAVLASTVGGIPEQVVDGETGVLIPPGDRVALKKELESLTSNKDLLRKMGEDGYTRLVNQGWTWKDYARRVSEVHETAIRESKL